MNYLTRILDEKKSEVSKLKSSNPRGALADAELQPTRSFADAIRRKPGDPLRLIAEIKKASPSRGVMVEDFKPVEIATLYHQQGAAAFSVLTDEPFFKGHINDLKAVRAALPLPVLRKDFIIDESQLYESRLIGADAVLLIAAALAPSQLAEYLHLARELELDVLTEIHDEHELEIAIDADAPIIGINNRNLKDFSVDIETSVRLRTRIPQGFTAVSESGLKTKEAIMKADAASFDAVLIGEGLIGAENLYEWKSL
ncbi:MAG: indole-3-glycerol phosphate synthase TrpC [Rhizobacter sp.]|nr:indole-3-glycerol phosphate synthase TrpC [Chlorobiales bacterium]